SGPGFADTNQEIVFGVGHGCDGSDTQGIRIEIPAEVVSVRAVDATLGPATIELDDAGLVRFVSWQKPALSVLSSDSNYYKVSLRVKVPNRPFSTIYFPTRQTCLSAEGEELIVDWASTEPSESESGPEPAPALKILPKRYPGWNKFQVSSAIEDLSAYFADAVIVWRGNSAYSSNPTTTELIAETSGVSTLGALASGDEIWVKY
ncbi:MAG TPA: DUF1775 domain-containing protein, partial [Polyangiaceae bacterium]|nr:DUF1775 domain-containing protein [Polyangiaceae bacterium]